MQKQHCVWFKKEGSKRPVPIAMTAGSLKKMQDAYRLAMTPPPRNLCAALLAEMDALLKSRTSASGGNQIKIQSYTKKMQEFPADCVIKACQKYRPAPDDWFPSWGELQADIESFMKDRKIIYEALQGAELLSKAQRREEQQKRIRDLSADIDRRKKRLVFYTDSGDEPYTGYFKVALPYIKDLEAELKAIKKKSVA